ncbi:MAG TPA: rod shape-determining protein MreD [Blastocatellia bacterium]|nr:rod shape-determining protein MreD [Blastocatellia bacterium]
MQTLKIALTIIVALSLQMLLPKFIPAIQYVDLALVITVYFALQRAPLLGMIVGCLAGNGGDAVTGGILGVGGFSKTLIGYLVGVASVKLSLEHPLARLAVVALASAANTFLFVGLYQMLQQEQMLRQALPFTATWAEFGRTLGWKALADTVAAIVLFVILDRVFSEQTAARRMAIKKRFYE